MKPVRDDVDFGTIGRETLPDRIAERILALIEEKHLLPGDRLPPERELAEMMGVSRPALREALRALSMMKIVENRQRAGTYITSLEPEQLVEHLEFVFSLDDSTYLVLLEARKVVEPGLAKIAAGKISDQNIQDLESCLERSLRSFNDPQAFLRTDLELHQIICDIAGNAILSRFMASIVKLGTHSRYRTVMIPDVRDKTIDDHQRIVAALKARDPQLAYQAMTDHLEHVENRLKEEMLKEDQDE
jgi:GntR family transcriptional repressor for pyruvate dehydrogenase complex